MKNMILIMVIVLLSACSGQKRSSVVGVKSGGEYYALDYAAKEAVVRDDEKEKLICKRTIVTGSHFKQKRCTTKRQRELERDMAKRNIDLNNDRIARELAAEKQGK